MKHKQYIRMLGLCTLILCRLPAMSSDYITETLDMDSLLQLPVEVSMDIIHDIDYKKKPYLIDDLNEVLYQLVKRSIKEKKSFGWIAQIIVIYAAHNEQYSLAIDLIETTIKYHKPKDLYQKLNTQKYLGYLYCKVGEFGVGVELFEDGLAQAQQGGLVDLQADFYHHLCNEYEYLTLIDPSYEIEAERLRQKCYENALERDDLFSLAFQSLSRLTRDATAQEIKEQWQNSMQWLQEKNQMNDHRVRNLNLQYLEELFDAGHYEEYILRTNELIDPFEINSGMIYSTFLGVAHLKTGDRKNAAKYARIATNNFDKLSDYSAKRAVIIWLPTLLYDLGMYDQALYFSEIQNNILQKQISHKGRISSERQRFDRELEHEINRAEQQKANNRYLAAGLALLAITLIVIGLSVRTLRNKNLIIEESLKELEAVNQDLNQANKDLESFAYASANNIKNPLGNISGMMQMVKLDDSSSLSDQSQNYMKAIDTSVRNLSTLLSSILRFANLGNKKVEISEVDFESLIEEAQILLYKQIQDSQAKVVVQPDLTHTLGDPYLLQQFVLNIISNAIKYSRPGIAPHLEINSYQDEHYVYYEFRDYGIGIPEDQLTEIFNLFGRADNSHNYEGVGLGLAVSLKIAQLHKGQLMVRNNPEYGATFILQLPLSTKKERRNDALVELSPA